MPFPLLHSHYRLCVLVTAIGLGARVAAQAGDWPQFLGPNRDGTYPGPALAKTWPKDGPTVVWQREVGEGFAGVAVSGGRMVLFHRLGDKVVVECCDAKSGAVKWKAEQATDYSDDFGFDEGPRATPAIAGGRVFTYGAEGRLSAWNLEDGKALWSVDTVKELGSGKGFFGRACSPLVEGGLVILNIGGKDGAGMVAFDAASGKVKWKATEDEASYSSPVAANVRGHRTVVAVTREALVALSPEDGKVILRHPWRPPMGASVSAATPLVLGDEVFLSASYGAGAGLFRFKDRGLETVWSGDEAISSHYATSVLHQGFLYGWHGRQEEGCELRCVEWKTGKVRWSQGGLKAGTVTLADGELLVLTEGGELIRAAASPEGFKPVARVQVLGLEVRAAPALADGLFFARSRKKLVCLDLGRDEIHHEDTKAPRGN